MRSLAVLLVLCVLLAGPASAAVLKPAALPHVTKAGLSVNPAVTMIPGRTLVAIPADVWISLRVSSVPAGAAITVDGTDTLQGTTPLTLGLRPGSHTLRLSLDGYRDAAMTVNLQQGSVPDEVFVQLERVPAMAASRETIPALTTVGPQDVIDSAGIPGALRNPDTFDSCLYGQQCLTLAESEAAYPGNWWYTQSSVCGYGGTNGTEPKYCTGGETVGPGRVAGTVPVPVLVTVSRFSAPPDITLPSVQTEQTAKVLGAPRDVGVFESILGFFSGLFSHPVCKEGWTVCGSACFDLMNDSMNCGSCDFTCFESVCREGECVDPTQAALDAHAPDVPLS